jgi:hypothetical protein
VRRVKNLLFLEPDPEWVQRKLLAMRNEAFALLPAQSSASHESMYTFVDGDNPFEGAPRQSPAIDRLINTIDKLFSAESASATTYLVVGWCKKNKTQIRSTIVELSDDECDSLADSLATNGEAIKAKYEHDKKAAEAGATTGK